MLLSGILLLAAMPASAQDVYRVQFDDDLSTVQVDACFDGKAPSSLRINPETSRYIRYARHGNRDLKPNLSRGRSYLPRLPEDACIEYAVDLKSALAGENFRLALDLGNQIVTETSLWFWAPRQRRQLIVEVTLPDGMNISTPWKPTGTSGNTYSFVAGLTPSSWTSRVAVGALSTMEKHIAGATFRVAVVGNFSKHQIDMCMTWLEESARSVSTVSGGFPQDNVQILMVGIGEQREPMPWAQVMRGGGISGQFFIDQSRPLSEFSDDWTPTHELSHMLLPYVSSSDRWLSEGLASYYQNVLRARDGRLSEQAAWQKLHEGFRRGVEGTHGQRLQDMSRNMRQNGAYMRVYWSGAAIFMLADIQLRQETNGEKSLDSVLARLHDCCMSQDKTWRARELFNKFDELSGTSIFSDLYNRHVPSAEFPDVFETYGDLGIDSSRRRIRLTQDAHLAEIRSAIMDG
jgi:hypothetical protein